MGDVPAEESPPFLPVQKVWAFQQESRGEDITSDSGQDVDRSAHCLMLVLFFIPSGKESSQAVMY